MHVLKLTLIDIQDLCNSVVFRSVVKKRTHACDVRTLIFSSPFIVTFDLKTTLDFQINKTWSVTELANNTHAQNWLHSKLYVVQNYLFMVQDYLPSFLQ